LEKGEIAGHSQKEMKPLPQEKDEVAKSSDSRLSKKRRKDRLKWESVRGLQGKVSEC